MIRLPRLLDSSLNEVRRISPVSFSVTENSTPLSTASIQLAYGDTIPNRAWVEMYTPNGSAGIFRVRTPSEAYGDANTTVELEHAITEVGDWLVEAEIESTVALNSAISTLFRHYGGSLWQLGSNTFTDTVTIDTDHENVLEAILGVMDQTPYMLSFDFTTSPWTVNVSQVDQNVSAEGRLSRNVLSAQISIDDSELATRVFASYKVTQGNQAVDVWINEQDNDAIATYGIIEAKDDGDYDDEASARAGAIKYLNKHKKPKISASISGYDFSAITGESLDRIRVGKKYRLAIEGESNPVEEVIKSINWQNLAEDEYQVTITLADEDDFLIKTLNSNKSAAKSSSKTKKKVENLHYEFYSEDGYFRALLDANEYHLRTTFDDLNNSLRADIEATAAYWRSTYEDLDNNLRGQVEQTAAYWRSTYEDLDNNLRGQVEQTAAYWRSTYEDTYNGFKGVVEQTASYWRSTYQDAQNNLGIIEQTASYWRSTYQDAQNNLGQIEQTATYWRSTYRDAQNNLGQIEQTAAYWRSTYQDAQNNLGQIEQTATYWRSTYQDAQNNLGIVEQTAAYWRSEYQNAEGWKTQVEQTASGWRTSLSGIVDSNGNVTAASIATAINAQGQAGVRISGSWIELDGEAVATSLQGQHIFADTLGGDDIIAQESIEFTENTVIKYGNASNDASEMIVAAEVYNNTLYLWPAWTAAGNRNATGVITFSKAVTSMGWSWSNGTLTVTPSPQGSNHVIGTLAKGTVSYSGGTYTIPITNQYGSGANTYTESTGKSLSLTPSVTAGTSAMTWDSTNKKFYNYGYAYLEGGSQAVATSTKRESSALSLDTSASWSSGTKSIIVKHGGNTILSDTISLPASSGTTWTNTSGNTWRADLSIGGTTRYSTTKDFTYLYNNGFNDTHVMHVFYENSSNQDVDISNTTTTLSYGQTLGVYPRFTKNDGSGYRY